LKRLDELLFDCLVFVMQQVKGLEEQLVSSRQPVFVFVLLWTCVHCWHMHAPTHLIMTLQVVFL
jgi:hypothetical protein